MSLFLKDISSPYPVALDARAELLESLAFTSMMQYSREDGWRAYWMLHSPTMPRWRTTLIAVSLSMWYSSLDNVWLGATTIESPEEGGGGNRRERLLTIVYNDWSCIWGTHWWLWEVDWTLHCATEKKTKKTEKWTAARKRPYICIWPHSKIGQHGQPAKTVRQPPERGGSQTWTEVTCAWQNMPR